MEENFRSTCRAVYGLSGLACPSAVRALDIVQEIDHPTAGTLKTHWSCMVLFRHSGTDRGASTRARPARRGSPECREARRQLSV